MYTAKVAFIEAGKKEILALEAQVKPTISARTTKTDTAGSMFLISSFTGRESTTKDIKDAIENAKFQRCIYIMIWAIY